MAPAERLTPRGFLNLNKPTGPTSRDVVDLVARPLKRARVKVGHAGTLDPLASGVLVVAVGAATRLIEQVQGHSKTYRTVVRLGARSDTLDADGQVVEVADPPIPTVEQVRAALATQVGEIEQIPPQYSALKVGGRRAYDLARSGQAVDLAPRRVRIDRVELLDYRWPHLQFEVDCGGGTYIRSIARDVGEALGCGGLIEVLIRTRIGPFRLEEAIDPDPDRLTVASIPGLLRPMLEAVAELPRIALNVEQAAAIARGQGLDPSQLGSEAARLSISGEVALIGPDPGDLLALATLDPRTGRLQPHRVFAGA
ncbi:tRNA pseudouridine(55) synthase TruB [soil metagenome]